LNYIKKKVIYGSLLIFIDESTGIDVKTCFFCTYTGQSVEDKCEHMAKVHSFYIPDIEHVSDLEGKHLFNYIFIKKSFKLEIY
jgi:hypothetical protein